MNLAPAPRIALHGGWLAGAIFTVALLGVAAATPGDEHAHQPVSLRLHVAMLTIALLGFLPATALLALAVRRTPGWRALATLGPVIGAATVLSVMERMTDIVPALAGAPGYGQRITLALYFLWLALAAGIALRQRPG